MFVYMLEHSSLLAWFWFMLFLAFGMAIYWFIRAKGSFAERVAVVKEKYFARNFEGLSVSVIFLICSASFSPSILELKLSIVCIRQRKR